MAIGWVERVARVSTDDASAGPEPDDGVVENGDLVEEDEVAGVEGVPIANGLPQRTQGPTCDAETYRLEAEGLGEGETLCFVVGAVVLEKRYKHISNNRIDRSLPNRWVCNR